MGSLGWALPTQDPLLSCPAPAGVPPSRKAVTSLWELEGRRAAWGNRVVGCTPLALREDRAGPRPGWGSRLVEAPAPACISCPHGHHTTHSHTHTHPATHPTQPGGSTSGVPGQKLPPADRTTKMEPVTSWLANMMAVYWAAQPGAGTEAGARHAAGGRRGAKLCRSMQARRQHQPATQELCQLLAREPGSANGKSRRAEAGSQRRRGVLPSQAWVSPARQPPGEPRAFPWAGAVGAGVPSGQWAQAVVTRWQGGWAWSQLISTSEEGRVPGGEPPPPAHRCHVDPRPRSGFPRTSLSSLHPSSLSSPPSSAWLPCSLLLPKPHAWSCPRSLLAPWPLPFPGCHSNRPLQPEAPPMTAPPPLSPAAPPTHPPLKPQGLWPCASAQAGAPRPRWSHEPAGEGQLLKQRLPKEAPFFNHSPPCESPCKGPEEQDPRPAHVPCTWRSPGTRATSLQHPQSSAGQGQWQT